MGSTAIIRVANALDGMVNGRSGRTARTEGQSTKGTWVDGDGNIIGVALHGCAGTVVTVRNTDTLEVHFEIEGEGAVRS